MSQKQSPQNRFISQYAVLAKHILCKSFKGRVFQTETAFQRVAGNVNRLSKSQAGEALKDYVVKAVTKEAKQSLEKMVPVIMNALGTAGMIAGGVVGGIAIGAALSLIQMSLPQKPKPPSIKEQIGKVFTQKDIQDTQNFLKTYFKCYTSQGYFHSFFQTLKNESGKKVFDKLDKLQTIISRKNTLYQLIIQNKYFNGFDFQYQVYVVNLFYQLTKVQIQILYMFVFKNLQAKQIQSQLNKLKSQHQQVKQKMKKIIGKKINHSTTLQLKKSGYNQLQKPINLIPNQMTTILNLINIYFNHTQNIPIITIQSKNKFVLYDLHNLCTIENFPEAIFNQIFKCPITEYKIENIYEVNTWISPKNYKEFDLKSTNKEQTCKYIGYKQPKYNHIKIVNGCRIRKIAPRQKIWTFYYENLTNKSGSHDPDYGKDKNGNETYSLDFDRARVIYRNGKNLEVFRDDGQTQVIARDLQPLTGSDANYCFQLSKKEFISHISYSQFSNICFSILNSSDTKHQQDWNNVYLSGFIQSPDLQYRVGYGSKLTNIFDHSKGFNFHGKATNQPSQQLRFKDITAISYDFGGQIPSSFTCKITSQADTSMFMVRDGRANQSDTFGNNQGGGQLIKFILKKTGTDNLYEADLQIQANGGNCKVYIGSGGSLQWTKGKKPNQKKLRVFIDPKKRKA